MNIWLATVVTLLIQTVGTFSVITVPVTVPAGGDTLAMGPVLLGGYTAVVYTGAMLAGLACTRHITRIGSIRMSQAALLSTACGMLLVEAGTLFAMFGAILVGFGYGPLTPTSSEILSRATDRERRNLVFSIKQTGVPLGGAACGAVLPLLIQWAGWRAGPGFAALMCVLAVLAVEPARRRLDYLAPATAASSAPMSFRTLVAPLRLVMSEDALRRLALTAFFLAAIQLAMTTHLVSFLGRALGFSLPLAGSMLATVQIAGVCGRLVSGWLADRYRNAGVVLAVQSAAIVVAALGYCAIALTGRTDELARTALVVLSVIFGASALGWNGTLIAEVTSRAPAGSEASGAAGVLTFTSLGGILGGLAFGLFADSPLGYAGAFIAMAVPAAFAFAALARLPRR